MHGLIAYKAQPWGGERGRGLKFLSFLLSTGAAKDGIPTNHWRTNPHVQSYALATDQKGLATMRADPAVFDCYASLHDAIYYSELGSSLAILRAGYNIDSLMLRYQVRHPLDAPS
jgi:hypothetical protein